ncbi:MAG: type 4a pilus biogenesis protein PilO [Acidobacteriota bacterium]
MLEKLSISRLPQRTQLVILTLIVGAFCYLFYSRYIQPLKSEVDALQTRIEALTVEVQRGQIVEARLPDFKQQVRQQEEKLARLRQILPEEKETAEIVRRIQELAVQSNLRIRSFTPQKTIRKDFYEDWPILIALEGNYDSLGTFFESVGQFTRIINVEGINIKSVEGKSSADRTLSAICTATTFVFVEGADSLLDTDQDASTANNERLKKADPEDEV